MTPATSNINFFSHKNFSKFIGYSNVTMLVLVALSAIGLCFGIYPFASSAIFSLKPMMIYSLIFAGAMSIIKMIQAIFCRRLFSKITSIMMNEIIKDVAVAAILGMLLGITLYNGLSLVFWIVRSGCVLIHHNYDIAVEAIIICSLIFGSAVLSNLSKKYSKSKEKL